MTASRFPIDLHAEGWRCYISNIGVPTKPYMYAMGLLPHLGFICNSIATPQHDHHIQSKLFVCECHHINGITTTPGMYMQYHCNTPAWTPHSKQTLRLWMPSNQWDYYHTWDLYAISLQHPSMNTTFVYGSHTTPVLHYKTRIRKLKRFVTSKNALVETRTSTKPMIPHVREGKGRSKMLSKGFN